MFDDTNEIRLDDLKSRYEAKCSPIHALEAISFCSSIGIPARTWSMRALEQPTIEIVDICHSDMSDAERGRRIMKVLGLDYRQYLVADSLEALNVIEHFMEQRRDEVEAKTGSRPTIDEALAQVKREIEAHPA